MESTVLYGNGLNLLSLHKLDWQRLLKDLASKAGHTINFPDDKPYTMAYEEILLMGKKNGKLDETEIKSQIINKLNVPSLNPVYDRLCDLRLKNYITTNYEFNLEKSFEEKGFKKKHNKQEDIYSIRSHVEIYSGKELESKIWHIHGDIGRIKSISLGLDHYCGTIGKMDAYFKGNYEYERDKKKIRLKSINNKLLGKDEYDNMSWIELFYNTNIHIIGFGLDFSETDLWWLLARRARSLDKTYPHPHNYIYYYCEKDDKKLARKELLESFGVIYREFERDTTKQDKGWLDLYGRFFDDLEANASK